jgi:hypothetical protein
VRENESFLEWFNKNTKSTFGSRFRDQDLEKRDLPILGEKNERNFY